MLPRCCIVVKQVCQKAATPGYERNCSVVLSTVRQFYLLNGTKNNPSLVNKRSFIWTNNLLNGKKGGSSEIKEPKKSEKVVADKAAATAKGVSPKEAPPKQHVQTQITKAVAGQEAVKPAIAVVASKIIDNKNVGGKQEVLVNIQEGEIQSNIVSAEPIEALQDKILGSLPKESTEVKTPLTKEGDDNLSAAGETPAPAAPAKPKRQRVKVDYSAETMDRNFITPIRALGDFLLKPSDLENLPKTKRRSPYENEPPMTVYWRKDVQAKAVNIWGSMEILMKERTKREIERKKYQQNIFTVKRRLRDYRREMGRGEPQTPVDPGIKGRSGRVVVTAVIINGANFVVKLGAWLYTGSHSMFAECIHSFADTINQCILAYGIHKSVQIADSYHPYGYTNMKYVSSLISGVGIFCVGTGLSFYHGISGLLNPEPVDDFLMAYLVLGGSLVSEGATWWVAFNSIRKGAKEANMPVKDFIFRGQDPSVNVVLLEDFAAVVGVLVAGTCIGLSAKYSNPIPDAVGSLLVGGILGCVASFIIYTNVAALVGRSIPEENLEKINAELESDVMVRAIHDVKGIDMGGYLVRYKAEVDFDGRELTKSYLDRQDLPALLEEVKRVDNIDDVEDFILKHGENIVDTIGGEVDRIEFKLRKKHPEIRHCDLEIL